MSPIIKYSISLIAVLVFFCVNLCFGQLDEDFLRYKKMADINFSNQRYHSSKLNFEKALAIKDKDEYCLVQIKNCNKKLTELKDKQQSAQIAIISRPIRGNTHLKLELKTNKGINNVLFAENEVLRISLKVSESCFVRLVYKLADDKLILLRNDFKIEKANTDKWILLPEEFICTAPFGLENLIGYASDSPFPPLLTKKNEGYTVILEELSSVIASSQKSSKNKNNKFSESRISILTEELISEER